MYKSKHGLSPELLKDIFIERFYQGPALSSDFVLPKKVAEIKKWTPNVYPL